MWGIIVTSAILLIISYFGYRNIRSLIRKMKVNPSKKIDLGIGILVWGTAFVLMLLELLKHLNIIGG